MQNISVLLPVRNGERFLQEALNSIRSNVSRNDEVLVINDNSSDATSRILRFEATNFPQLRVLENSGSGLVNALNLGLREASWDWIARFDVDDKYSPNRLEMQRKMISTGTVGIFSDYSIWSERGNFLGLIPSPVFPIPTGISLVQSQRTAHPSALLNKLAVLSVGGYRAEDFPAEDLSLWLRLIRCGNLTSCPLELLYYQRVSTSVSNLNYQKVKIKKRDLLTEIGLPLRYLGEALNRCDETLEEYSLHSLSMQRKLLHLKELKFGFWLYGSSKKEKLELAKKFASLAANADFSRAALDLMKWKVTRKFYSINLNSKNYLQASN